MILDSKIVLEIVRNALNNNNLPVSTIILNCKRVATMRADIENLWWIEYELHSGEELKDVAKEFLWRFGKDKIRELGPKYAKLWLEERQINKYDISNCNIISSDNVLPFSIGGIEANRKADLNQFSSLPKTDNMHTLDVYYTENANSKARIFLSKTIEDLDRILDRIRTRAFDYLIQVEAELMRGNSLSQYFDRNKEFVTMSLGSIDHQILEELDKIDIHLFDATSTDYSESLLDVRRILCHFADIVCPPSDTPKIGSDGKQHNLKSDKYLNRLEFAVYEKAGKHTSTDLITSNLSELCTKLENLNSLSCKGVHANVTAEEAYMCVTQMYLMLGEMIRILQ